MPRKSRTRNLPRSRRKTGPPMQNHAFKPPSFEVNKPAGFIFRFYCPQATTGDSITRADLLSRLVMATGATTAYRLFSSVKVNLIEMWGVTTDSSSSRVAVEWVSENGPNKIISDSSTSTAYPSYIRTKPPIDSLCGAYCTSGTSESTVVFKLQTLAVNTIVDIHCTCVLLDASAGDVGVAVTIAGGTAGVIGAPSLDHSSTGNNYASQTWPPYV